MTDSASSRQREFSQLHLNGTNDNAKVPLDRVTDSFIARREFTGILRAANDASDFPHGFRFRKRRFFGSGSLSRRFFKNSVRILALVGAGLVLGGAGWLGDFVLQRHPLVVVRWSPELNGKAGRAILSEALSSLYSACPLLHSLGEKLGRVQISVGAGLPGFTVTEKFGWNNYLFFHLEGPEDASGFRPYITDFSMGAGKLSGIYIGAYGASGLCEAPGRDFLPLAEDAFLRRLNLLEDAVDSPSPKAPKSR